MLQSWEAEAIGSPRRRGEQKAWAGALFSACARARLCVLVGGEGRGGARARVGRGGIAAHGKARPQRAVGAHWLAVRVHALIRPVLEPVWNTCLATPSWSSTSNEHHERLKCVRYSKSSATTNKQNEHAHLATPFHTETSKTSTKQSTPVFACPALF